MGGRVCAYTRKLTAKCSNAQSKPLHNGQSICKTTGQMVRHSPQLLCGWNQLWCHGRKCQQEPQEGSNAVKLPRNLGNPDCMHRHTLAEEQRGERAWIVRIFEHRNKKLGGGRVHHSKNSLGKSSRAILQECPPVWNAPSSWWTSPGMLSQHNNRMHQGQLQR